MSTAVQSVAPRPEAPLLELDRRLLELGDQPPNPKQADRIAAGLRRAGAMRTSEAADLLARAAEKSSLAEWKTSDGVDLRTLAVELLVDMGHPFALAVPPDALEAVRKKPRGRVRRLLARASTIVGALLTGVAFGLSGGGAGVLAIPLVVLLAAVGLYRAEGPRRGLGVALLVTLAALDASIAYVADPVLGMSAGISAALVALAAVLYATLPAGEPR